MVPLDNTGTAGRGQVQTSSSVRAAIAAEILFVKQFELVRAP